MYYKMRTIGRQLTAMIDQESGPLVYQLTMGRHYEAKPEKLPFRFSYQKLQDGPLIDYIDGEALMSKRLVTAIEAAGVDNLQAYPAELRDEATGELNEGFVVVNIVGLVAAADLAQSDSLPLGGGQVFTDLALDEGQAHGLLMFRLSESLEDVIIHERVAKAIEEGDFPGVALVPLTS